MSVSGEEMREEFLREALVHVDALYGLGRRLTGGDASEAEDLVRETVLGAYRARDDRRIGPPDRAWLMAILRDRFLSGYREEGRRSDPGDDDEAGSRSAFGDPGDAERASDVLDRRPDREIAEAVEELEDALRVPLVLADLEGLSYGEIAQALDVPVGTVRSRLSRARRRLQRRLCGRAGEEGPATSADDRSGGVPPRERAGGGPGGPGDPGCRDAREMVYEYLDGELDPETQERIHRHVETCQRCHPYFDFERLFLDSVRERGLATGDAEVLRGRLERWLERGG